MAHSSFGKIGAAIAIGLAVAGCDLEETATVVKIICPTVQKYDKATQDRALAELRALPAGSALKLMIGDYKQLRDRIEVCRQQGAKP